MTVNWNARSYTKEEFIKVWKNSQSIAEVIRALELNKFGGSYASLNKAAEECGLTKNHMIGQGHLKGKTHSWNVKIPTEELLVKGRHASTSNLKKRLWKEGLLPKKCQTCGLEDWLGKPAPLALDHINGDNTDNRIENLRILCYNCHGQTETYCSKNFKGNEKTKEKLKKIRKRRLEKDVTCPICLKPCRLSEGQHKSCSRCIDCESPIKLRSGKEFQRCVTCNNKLPKKTKIDWPSIEGLLKMVENSNKSIVAKELGVSEAAVRKRIREHR